MMMTEKQSSVYEKNNVSSIDALETENRSLNNLRKAFQAIALVIACLTVSGCNTRVTKRPAKRPRSNQTVCIDTVKLEDYERLRQRIEELSKECEEVNQVVAPERTCLLAVNCK